MKDLKYILVPELHKVIIDTCWNVKFSITYVLLPGFRVIIDTCWNVKLFVLPVISMSLERNNRYMLECEDNLHIIGFIGDHRNNRYMLECEDDKRRINSR